MKSMPLLMRAGPGDLQVSNRSRPPSAEPILPQASHADGKAFSPQAVLYRRAYEMTCLTRGWKHRDVILPGSAMRAFQALEQASMMALWSGKT